MQTLRTAVSAFLSVTVLGALPALLALSACELLDVGGSGVTGVTVMNYNVENLFDDVSDGTEFRGFDPAHDDWDTRSYHAKLDNIAAVVEAAVSGGPDILALQEIENARALQTLADEYLGRFGYDEAVMVQVPGIAFNVALLSRFPVRRVASHRLRPDPPARLRNILEVELAVDGQRLIVFVNHWKSKHGGGAEVTEPLRVAAAELLRLRLFELLSQDSQAQIIVLGDLNLSYDEYRRVEKAYQTALIPKSAAYPQEYHRSSLFVTDEAARAGIRGDKVVLYTPWKGADERGSYVHQQDWYTIDHMLFSPAMLSSDGLELKSFSVVKEEFMLNRFGEPLRWDAATRSGFSDHLPLLARLRKH